MTSISESYELIKSQIRTAEEKSGRVAGSVELIAVSKTWPAEVVSELVECGHRDFGENRVQELELKHPDLPSSLRWHFIGHLQKNKVRKAVNLYDYIQTVDSLSLAKRINKG